MKLINCTKIFFISLTILTTGGCIKDDKKETDFDRTKMLSDYYDNMILPAYSNLDQQVQLLKGQIESFSTNPSIEKLGLIQNEWVKTYSIWMSANTFNFGPTGEEGIRKGLNEEIGTFPVNTSIIEKKIRENQLTVTDFNRDNRGLLCLEYLLFDIDIKTAFEKLANPNRMAYLKIVTNDIAQKVVDAKKNWSSYRDVFTKNNGTEVGSSTSQLYNEFLKSYEGIKNFKLALPLGLRAGQTKAEPKLVEGFYSGRSVDFLDLHLQSIESIYLGNGKVQGIGFRTYLESVEGGSLLATSIKSQIAVINATLDKLPKNIPLSDQIVSNPTPATDLQRELQKNTRFFKSDMSSLLGLAITFSSGDGD